MEKLLRRLQYRVVAARLHCEASPAVTPKIGSWQKLSLQLVNLVRFQPPGSSLPATWLRPHLDRICHSVTYTAWPVTYHGSGNYFSIIRHVESRWSNLDIIKSSGYINARLRVKGIEVNLSNPADCEVVFAIFIPGRLRSISSLWAKYKGLPCLCATKFIVLITIWLSIASLKDTMSSFLSFWCWYHRLTENKSLGPNLLKSNFPDNKNTALYNVILFLRRAHITLQL